MKPKDEQANFIKNNFQVLGKILKYKEGTSKKTGKPFILYMDKWNSVAWEFFLVTDKKIYPGNFYDGKFRCYDSCSLNKKKYKIE